MKLRILALLYMFGFLLQGCLPMSSGMQSRTVVADESKAGPGFVPTQTPAASETPAPTPAEAPAAAPTPSETQTLTPPPASTDTTPALAPPPAPSPTPTSTAVAGLHCPAANAIMDQFNYNYGTASPTYGVNGVATSPTSLIETGSGFQRYIDPVFHEQDGVSMGFIRRVDSSGAAQMVRVNSSINYSWKQKGYFSTYDSSPVYANGSFYVIEQGQIQTGKYVLPNQTNTFFEMYLLRSNDDGQSFSIVNDLSSYRDKITFSIVSVGSSIVLYPTKSTSTILLVSNDQGQSFTTVQISGLPINSEISSMTVSNGVIYLGVMNTDTILNSTTQSVYSLDGLMTADASLVASPTSSSLPNYYALTDIGSGLLVYQPGNLWNTPSISALFTSGTEIILPNSAVTIDSYNPFNAFAAASRFYATQIVYSSAAAAIIRLGTLAYVDTVKVSTQYLVSVSYDNGATYQTLDLGPVVRTTGLVGLSASDNSVYEFGLDIASGQGLVRCQSLAH